MHASLISETNFETKIELEKEFEYVEGIVLYRKTGTDSPSRKEKWIGQQPPMQISKSWKSCRRKPFE